MRLPASNAVALRVAVYLETARVMRLYLGMTGASTAKVTQVQPAQVDPVSKYTPTGAVTPRDESFATKSSSFKSASEAPA